MSFNDNYFSVLKKILNIIVALVFGLLTVIGISAIGLVLYDYISGFWGILVGLVFVLIGLYLGYRIFITSKRRGVINFITAVYASPELDNIEPTGDTSTRKLSVNEYVQQFESNNLRFSGGYIRIWGDFKSRQLETINEIDSIKLIDPNTLQIVFQSNNVLTIWNPQTVIESNNFVKILKADKVRWEWMDKDKNDQYFCTYEATGNKIKLNTNYNWKSDSSDISFGEPAFLMIR